MKIQEGCENRCAYCVIPRVRGPVRSMPLGAVAAEARALGGAGYRELVVTGIHLMSYGATWGWTSPTRSGPFTARRASGASASARWNRWA
jgi:tRNA A37 methylthiotransferase MiaB